MRQFYVYIMASRSRTLYIGVANDLVRRVYQHKQHQGAEFTTRYNITRLVYYEFTQDVRSAIAREKQLKGWLRTRKLTLVETMNPAWEDLSTGWYDHGFS